MNYKAIIKKQSTIIAIAVICLTVATVGVSYALFFQVETNTNNQIVTAGTLNVEYGSGSSAIAATELVPMSDAEALSSSTMTGTIYIENTGTLPANYEVKIGNDTEAFNSRSDALDTDVLLSHDYIRIAAYLDGTMLIEPTTLSKIEAATDDETMRSLFKSNLNTTGTGENTATIVLKIWIDETAPESIIGNYVYLKMDVTSEVEEENLLPDGYQQVEYLASSGTQWIDTGFTPNQDTRVVVDYQFTEITSAFLFGSRTSASSNAYAVNVSSSNLVTSYGTSGNTIYATADTERHVIDKNKNIFYVEGNKLTQTTSTFTAPGTLEIFAAYNAGTEGYLPSKAKIYSFRIYDNETLVRNFVPCYKIADSGNVNGLYDTVNNTFYANSGTGTFDVGSDVN